MTDTRPSPIDEPLPPAPDHRDERPTAATPPLLLLEADDTLACVDELCLPVEALQ